VKINWKCKREGGSVRPGWWKSNN